MQTLIRYVIATGMALLSGMLIARAQTDTSTINGVYVVGNLEQWYSNYVELGPNAELYFQDGATILFYGNYLKIDPGAKFYGTNSDFSIITQGISMGKIVFQQPNPNTSTTVQQLLDGGNSGNPANTMQNTLTTIEINNPLGVKLVGTDTRIGTNVLFTSGSLYLDTHDAVLTAAATISNADASRYVVTGASGHLVKENLAGSFLFPVGKAINDYTPASITPTGANTVHVNVTDSAGAAASSVFVAGTDGIGRIWNIYGNNATGATVELQHNSGTNQASFSSTQNFVTQYGIAPNNTGDNSSASAWQSNTLGGSTTVGSTEVRSRSYSALATTTGAKAWFSVASNPATPLPLTITAFSARASNCDAALYWTAGHVEAGASFTVERSSNGSSFAAIATVAASPEQGSYSYTDKEALNEGSRYYRLKLSEPEGSYQYSTVQQVQACNATAGNSFMLAPNPAYGGQSVELLYSGAETEAWCQITDIPGQVLQRSSRFRIGGTAGSSYNLQLNGIAKGTYVVTLVSADGKIIGRQKLAVQ